MVLKGQLTYIKTTITVWGFFPALKNLAFNFSENSFVLTNKYNVIKNNSSYYRNRKQLIPNVLDIEHKPAKIILTSVRGLALKFVFLCK